MGYGHRQQNWEGGGGGGGEPGAHIPLEEILPPLKLLGVVTFVTTFAVIDHCEVRSRNCSCPGHQFIYKMLTLSGLTHTRSTISTCDD